MIDEEGGTSEDSENEGAISCVQGELEGERNLNDIKLIFFYPATHEFILSTTKFISQI